jgi:hypothetical protein
MHAWEWLLLGSLPLGLVWLMQAFKSPRQRSVLPLSLLLTMIILLLSNTARGETGRVWLFFTPFAMLSAGLWIHDSSENPVGATHESPYKNQLTAIFIPLLIAQAAILMAVAPTWDTMFAPDIHPTPPPPAAAEGLTATSIQFGEAFRLVGWHGIGTGSTITFDFAFQSLRQLDRPYHLSILPVAPDGSTPIAPLIWQPHSTTYPATCWQPDQIVGESITINAEQPLMAGDWWFSVRAFEDLNSPTEALSVLQSDGSADTQAGIGPVTVNAP